MNPRADVDDIAGGRFVPVRRSALSTRGVPQMFGYRMPPLPGVHRGLPGPYLTLVFSLSGELPIEVPAGVRSRAGAYAIPIGGLHNRPVLLPPITD
ncbi:MAG: hypothetical protein ABWZ98_14135, partial [Nakamurella sp.]